MVNTSESFLVLDNADLCVLRHLSEHCEDFDNLEEIDKKIVVWILTKKPEWLEGWISFLMTDYSKTRSTELCWERLMAYLTLFSDSSTPVKSPTFLASDVVDL